MSSEIAQISEVYLNDPNAVKETAPSSITLEVYQGLAGNRGTYVIPGLGNPNTYDFANSYILDNGGNPQTITPQPLDWFINLSPTDPTYLTVFQLNNSGQKWDIIFKIIPNVYSQNTVANFVAGTTQYTFYVPKEALRLEQLFGDYTQEGYRQSTTVYRIPDETDTVETVDSEAEMLAISGAVAKQYVYRTDKSQFFRLLETPANILVNWQPELSININLDLETPLPALPLPTSVGFSLSTPSSDEDFYIFPITINAVEGTFAGVIQPVVGERIIHATISVI